MNIFLKINVNLTCVLVGNPEGEIVGLRARVDQEGDRKFIWGQKRSSHSFVGKYISVLFYLGNLNGNKLIACFCNTISI